jgi:hypothetical protein
MVSKENHYDGNHYLLMFENASTHITGTSNENPIYNNQLRKTNEIIVRKIL